MNKPFGVCALLVAAACAPPPAQAPPLERPPRSTEAAPVSPDGAAEAPHDEIVCDRLVDDFSEGAEGSFPPGWETHPQGSLELARREGLYRVVTEQGRRVLHARSGADEVILGRGITDWDLERYPIVEWEWKVVELPSEHADSAAAEVTAVWKIGLPFVVRRLGYAYGSQQPVGARLARRFGYDQTLVVDSGARHRGTWRRVRVHLLEHYRSLFGREDANPPTGLALRTAAGEPGTRAEAYYANVRLCRPTPPTRTVSERR